ncbi:2-dehydro-3-deoxyphosphogluconate aldolase [Kosakonia sp. H02]|nr:2-dehydro-3-deoxyphosphogluconate aldolase [Kosakonia sp. H02]
MINSKQIVAILRGITPAECVEQVACLRDHGITCVEITTNSPEWQISLAQVHKAFGESIDLGAGTVLTASQVENCHLAGAGFILTPNLDARVVEAAKQHGLRVCAGVFTSSEIFRACELDVDVLKIFPAGALPLNYPQMIKGPLSQGVSFSAVGGVEVENAADYLPYYNSVGIGSSLYRPGQSVAVTAQRARQLLNSGE